MALSRVEGLDELYFGGIWALRRSDSLTDRGITHVLSLVGFNTANLKNFKDEPWSEYGKAFQHLVIDVDDVDDADLLVELPRVVKFIDQGLRGTDHQAEGDDAALEKGVDQLSLSGGTDARKRGGVFVHCAAGKSRSATAVIAYLLWRYPERFDPDAASPTPGPKRPRKDTAAEAAGAALAHVRRTRPMAEPNPGFAEQLELWWQMGCPDDVEAHHTYQRWAYKREVEQHTAIGQAPARLRFEDEEAASEPATPGGGGDTGPSVRCKKCRRTLATAPFIVDHRPPAPGAPPCQHVFVEPLSWMRGELERGALNGRLLCPNARCGAGVGRYDWKGFRCSCGAWVTPGMSLQRARVDEVLRRDVGATAAGRQGIRMPPGMPPGRGGNL